MQTFAEGTMPTLFQQAYVLSAQVKSDESQNVLTALKKELLRQPCYYMNTATEGLKNADVL